ncbi:MAG TPA: ABC transporter permease [Dehalococcoidia bacterium]|nr:ABC transporter permease [Dehalococcoidia bacterium]
MNTPALFRLGSKPVDPDEIATGTGPWRILWRRLRRKRLAMVSLGIILFMYFCGIFAPVLAPYSFSQGNITSREAVEQPPSREHLLGTDRNGRDIFSRIIWGARTATIISLTAVTLSVIFGTVLGLIAGYFRGIAEVIIMRTTDILFAFPSLLLILLIAATVKPVIRERLLPLEENPFLKGISGQVDYIVIFTALSIVSWPGIARLIRAQVLVVREATYVEAARSMGASNLRILLRHVLPNSVGPLLVAISFSLGAAVGSEATLSFIGIGVQPPNPSWGQMINEEAGALRSLPYLLLVPSFVIAILLLAFNFLGDGINDILNSRQ